MNTKMNIIGTAELTKDPNIMILQTQKIGKLQNVNKVNTALSFVSICDMNNPRRIILMARANLYLLEKNPAKVDLEQIKEQLEYCEKLIDVKSVDLSKSLLGVVYGTKARLYAAQNDV